MKPIYIAIACFFSTNLGYSQNFQEISTGPGYNKQSFVRLADGTEKQVSNDSWDIAFTAFGFQDAGVFINESSGSSMGQNLPQTELYYALTDDFNAPIDLEAIKTQKYLNSETSWLYGAFNEERDTLAQFDYGWGSYGPGANKLVGNKVFVLKLRNGEFRKLKIDVLNATTYTFRYAKLDGSDAQVKNINKLTDNKGQKLIFYNLTSHSTVDVLPAGGFDLMYCRYVSIAKDPNGSIVQQYIVTGVLSGPGVQTAEADGVNPGTVSFMDYKEKLSTNTDIIGYDWKTLSGTSWVLDQDKVFFVKTAENRIWKLHFIDFEGSSTGVAVFEKTDLGTFSSTSDLPGVEVNVYPNPTVEQLTVALNTEFSKDITLTITDMQGKVVQVMALGSHQGLRVIDCNVSDLAPGKYTLVVSSNGKGFLKQFVKQ